MVCIDQSTGEKSVEPLRTIAAAGQGKMQFGVYFSQLSSDSRRCIIVGSPVKLFDL
jgi:molybdenum cofactor sulfurtransferase